MALAHVHKEKLLHRDIKAENVFLTDDGLTVKLGDFGIAKSILTTSGAATTGSGIGTVTHFAPEICNGSNYDVRCETWSLGVLLYHLAALQLPVSKILTSRYLLM